MYIPEFWCGVIATLFIELALVVVYGIYLSNKNKEIEEK